MATVVETKIVCDALALMRRNIQDEYNDSISNLPRHGKGVATTRDDDNEDEVLRRIKSLDALMESFSKDSGRKVASARPEKPEDVVDPTEAHAFGNVIKDYDPFINPFTGQWVVPDSPDKPGPSGITNTAPSTPNFSPPPASWKDYASLNGVATYTEPTVATQSTGDNELKSAPVPPQTTSTEAARGRAPHVMPYGKLLVTTPSFQRINHMSLTRIHREPCLVASTIQNFTLNYRHRLKMHGGRSWTGRKLSVLCETLKISWSSRVGGDL